MNGYRFTLAGAELFALPSRALWWADRKLLCVSDLHLGKSERIARRGGAPLPPYETRDTLMRFENVILQHNPRTVVCLGDSFDDAEAAMSLGDDEKTWISRLQAGRRWVWIEGNHDPGPVELGGTHLQELPEAGLTFRHIARAGASGEISGHYHPKARLIIRGRPVTKPCFLLDSDRAVLPAFGTYTGGLRSDEAVLSDLMRSEALAVLTGSSAHALPMPK